MLFVTLFKGLISRGPLDLKVCLLLIGCCLVSSFVQNPLQFQRGGFVTFSCSKNWHFWSLLWGSSLLFWFWWREFQNSENLTTNLKNVSFLSKKKWQTHLFKNWRGFCTKLDTWQQPIRSKHSFRSKGPLEIEPLKRVTKSIIETCLQENLVIFKLF